ncbi:MAG: AAA-like domain-containing protein [Eubacteriales bacterium]|nr:AAA-like domain-containing protein [Eubacteriales bacterium]
MSKIFNIDGACDPELHYMVDISGRLQEIKAMVDSGKYFTINRARQYGKTTTLAALSELLKDDYQVFSLDFQTISYGDFESEQNFVAAFSREVLDCSENISDEVRSELELFSTGKVREATLSVLFKSLIKLCRKSEKKIVLIIDEVDTATSNQVFVDFLAQLRAYYLKRRKTPTFHSVILAGVYDVRNIKRKLRPEEERKTNSPWNIAARFRVDMGFSAEDIAGMLKEYEDEHQTGMNIEDMSGLIYDYTSGYPYLVSWLCKSLDEDIAGSEGFPDNSSAWTKDGFLAAVKLLLNDQNPLFESLIGKLNDFPELNHVISRLLFQGQSIAYNPDDPAVQMAQMFGFIKVENSTVLIANRIFETRLYNNFLLKFKEQNSSIFAESSRQKNQFFINGYLNVKRILEKFVECFDELYGDKGETFLEEDGRRYFMLFLKPIINGIGNCYVEAETRNRERMDLVIDYLGEQYIIEMKIWRGNAYNERGEEQLSAYLDYFHLNKGYMLSFNFNKKKQIGVKNIVLGDKLIVEAVV